MKEISEHVLDIASNSIRAKSKNISIYLEENTKKNEFIFYIEDDGCGIDEDMLKTIKNPFTTTRKLRNVGLGIPLLNDNCELTGGRLDISSTVGVGTKLTAVMGLDNIDRPPIGDISSSIANFISSNEDVSISYKHIRNDKEFSISTKELKKILGDISLKEIKIAKWLREFIAENEADIKS